MLTQLIFFTFYFPARPQGGDTENNKPAEPLGTKGSREQRGEHGYVGGEALFALIPACWRLLAGRFASFHLRLRIAMAEQV